MAQPLILIDTSLLIDLFRKSEKEKALLVKLVRQGYTYAISAITEFEIYTGASDAQQQFWEEFLNRTPVLPFSKEVARQAVVINKALKKKRKQIAVPDLFIAATAVEAGLPLATLNQKHFDRVDDLQLIALHENR